MVDPCEGRHGFGGSSSEHLTGATQEQDCVRVQQEIKKKQLQEVLRTVLPAFEAYVASLMTPRIKPNMPK